jgi:hypothetical protein
LSPEVEDVPTASTATAATTAAAHSLATAIRPLLQEGGVLLLLDLEPSLAVQAAAQLAEHAHPVLVLPRWPYAEAVLPCDELLIALRNASHVLPQGENRLANVLFVLDGKRGQAVPTRATRDLKADNRHVLSSFDLPNLATLRARGIRRIHRLQHT